MNRFHSWLITLALFGSAAALSCSDRAGQQPLTPGPGTRAPELEQRIEIEVPPPAPAAGQERGVEGADAVDAPAPGATGFVTDAGGGPVNGAAPSRPTATDTPEPGATGAPTPYAGPGDSTPARTGATGGLRGFVRFEGQPPELPPLQIPPDAAGGCGDAIDTTDRSLLVDAAGGIANVVLTIQVAGKSAIPASKPVVIEQKACRFEPHVTLVPAGSDVQFVNSDATSANFHTYPRTHDATNVVIPPGGSAATAHYARSDTIEIKSDCCPWMGAWVVVTEVPFHTVTGEGGVFELLGLPPGPQQLSLWHEKLGEKKVRVDIVAGQVTESNLTFE